MIKVTYTTFSPVLDKSFTDTKTVKTISDFRTFAIALFHGNWEIVKTEKV